MSYIALYRKWRPDSFDDVKGQDHVVTTLKNQIKADRIGHAYLFCGSRGTGKTSIAKIFAKAVNCENPENGSPCGHCEMCTEISEGRSMNVIEIDAASNNGIDNIRQIREEVAHPPIRGKYLVYIIDEVHALSKDAFNALLKTLEEPPSYVIFILATTEIQSVLPTIISRCQRFDFKRISNETIVERLKEVTQAEGMAVEEKALRYIAKTANGGMRDAISMLDMCISYYYGRELTYDNVLDVLGAVDIEVFSAFLRNILFGNIKGAFEIVEKAVFEGRDLTQFTVEFTWYLRNLMLVKTSDNDVEDMLEVTSESFERLKEESTAVELDVIMRYIRIFSELSNDIKFASQKRILLEMAVIKLCKPAMENDLESLTDRVRQLEEKIESGYVGNAGNIGNDAGGLHNFAAAKDGAAAGMSSTGTSADGSQASTQQGKPVKQALPESVSEYVAKVPTIWHKVIGKFKDGMTKTAGQNVRFTALDSDTVTIIAANDIAARWLNRDDIFSEIKGLLAEELGADINIEIKTTQTGERFDDRFTDLNELSEMLNGFPVDVED